jgi:hypothetical protein
VAPGSLVGLFYDYRHCLISVILLHGVVVPSSKSAISPVSEVFHQRTFADGAPSDRSSNHAGRTLRIARMSLLLPCREGFEVGVAEADHTAVFDEPILPPQPHLRCSEIALDLLRQIQVPPILCLRRSVGL